MKDLIKKIISNTGSFVFSFNKKNIDRKKVKKILVISLYFKGDLLMNTPSVKLLSKIFPDAEIDIWVKSRTADIIQNNPLINEVLIFDRIKTADYNDSSELFLSDKLNFLKRIREKKYDLCIDLTGKYSTALIALLGNFRYSFGLNYNGFGFCYTKTTNVDTQHSIGSLTGKYIELIKQGLEINNDEYFKLTSGKSLKNEFYFSEEIKDEAVNILEVNGIYKGADYITVQTTAGWKAKEWSADKFSKLISDLSKKYKVILLGSEADRSYNEEIINSSGEKENCLALSLPFGLSAAVISKSSLFIGNDSAGLQVAGAFEVPSVALFGPTNPEFSNPEGDMHKFIYKKLHCSAEVSEQYCTRNAGKTCDDIQCMKNIEVNEVTEISNRLLKKNEIQKEPVHGI